MKVSKSLGVYIDEHLSWSNHIDHIAKKISSGLAGLKQVRPFVPTEVLISIFKALILPYFDYCDIVWAGLNKGLSERIDKLYNRAARIITQSKTRSDASVGYSWSSTRTAYSNYDAQTLA